MEGSLRNCIISVCQILNKHSVRYIIIGGAAVALYGYFRYSMAPNGKTSTKPDLDIWYNPSYDNYFSLLNALEELGFDVQEFKEEQMPNPKKSYFKFVNDSYSLDLLPSLDSGLVFSSCYDKKEIIDLEDVNLPIINLEDLIEDKKAYGRPKDKIDIEQLKNQKKKED